MTSEARFRAVTKYKQKIKRFSLDFCPTEYEPREHL